MSIIYHILYFVNYERKLGLSKIVSVNSDRVFFRKIIEMEYKEIFDKSINLEFYNKITTLEKQNHELLELNQKLQAENLELKTQINSDNKSYENK